MDDLFQTPENAISRRSSKIVYTPSGKSLVYDFMAIFNRVAHDEAIVELAKSKGAKLSQTHLLKILLTTKKIRNGAHTAKVIVEVADIMTPRRKFWKEKLLTFQSSQTKTRQLW